MKLSEEKFRAQKTFAIKDATILFPKFERCKTLIDDFDKTMLNFWLRFAQHSLLDSAAGFRLLKEWIVILYGREKLSELALDNLLDDISKSHIETNQECYEGKEETDKFIFASPHEQAIEQTIIKLGSYED